MTQREAVRMDDSQPASYRAMLAMATRALEGAHEAGLDSSLVELVKIRVSQLNGCTFCLQLHSGEALAAGEMPDRLAVLPAWRDSAQFTVAERAALEVAEDVTLVAHRTSTASATAQPTALLPTQRAAVQWIALAMNALNRAAIASARHS